jgi:hypothetical protein
VASTLVLLAVAGVVAYSYAGSQASKVSATLTSATTISAQIRGDYANNPAGYASLNNQVAIQSGAIPAGMVVGSSILNAWGSAVTLGPVAGMPTDFYLDMGAVPSKACTSLLTEAPDLKGASIDGTQAQIPVDPAAAAQYCTASSAGPMHAVVLQYGKTTIPVLPAQVSFAAAGAQSFTIPAGCTVATVKLWGGGGAGVTDTGGGGGFVQVQIPVSAGQTLSALTGDGGQPGTVYYYQNDGPSYAAGGGGGASSVTLGGVLQAVAGGGGGAGGRGYYNNGAAGGAGGGSAGANGVSNNVAWGGNGGTQSTGGAAGTGGAQEGGAFMSGGADHNAGYQHNTGGGGFAAIGWGGKRRWGTRAAHCLARPQAAVSLAQNPGGEPAPSPLQS